MSDFTNLKAFKIKDANAENVSSVTYYGDTLWIGQTASKIAKVSLARSIFNDKNNDDGPSSSFSIINQIEPNHYNMNAKVKQIIPIVIKNMDETVQNEFMIVHYIDQNSLVGQVEVIYPGGLKNQICDKAKIVMTTKSEGTVDDIRIACILNKNEIHVYKFVGRLVIEDWSVITNAENITKADMNDKSIVFHSNGKYYHVNLNGVHNVNEIVGPTIDMAHIAAISSEEFLLAYKESLAIVRPFDPNDKPIEKKYFDQNQPLHIYSFEDTIVQVYKKFVVKTDNYFGNMQRYDVKGVKCACMINRDIIFVSNDSWYITSFAASPKKLSSLIRGGEETKKEAYEMLRQLSPDVCFESLFPLFKALWDEEMFSEALELVENFAWIGDPRKLYSLFPDLDFSSINPRKMRPICSKQIVYSYKDDSIKYFETLCTATEKMFSEFQKDSFVPLFTQIAATALGELYVICQHTRKLDTLIKENKFVSHEDLRRFIEEGTKKNPFGPSYAIMQTRDGDIDNAMNTWEVLYRQSRNEQTKDFILTEASFTMKEFVGDTSDKAQFIKWLDWIKKSSEKAAVNALLSTKHDTSIVLEYISTKIKANDKSSEEDESGQRVLIRYLDYVIGEPDFIPSKEHLSLIFSEYIKILKDVESGNVREEDIDFVESIQDKEFEPNEKLKIIENEITQKALSLLKRHNTIIDLNQCADDMEGLTNPQLWLCIYGLKKEYGKAFEMMKNESGYDIERIQEFCRNSPDPPSAFTTAFGIIGVENIFKKSSKFISDNIAYVDPVETLKMIPETTPAYYVAETISMLYNLLVQRNESLNKQISINEPLKVDAKYRRSRARSKYCTVDKTSTCAKCGALIGNKQFFLGTDGELYCSNCKSTKH